MVQIKLQFADGVIIGSWLKDGHHDYGDVCEAYEFLSNFYPTKVVFDGITYYNAEAAYQAQKCLLQADRLRFAHLSADEAKRLGQKIEIRPDWDDIKYHVMEQVVYAKFAQNSTLAQDLLVYDFVCRGRRL